MVMIMMHELMQLSLFFFLILLNKGFGISLLLSWYLWISMSILHQLVHKGYRRYSLGR